MGCWILNYLLLLGCLLVLCNSDQDFVSCQNTLVLVRSVEASCDDDVCDYGDVAYISVGFDVLDDLDNGDDIYVKVELYTPDYDELIYEADPVALCSQDDDDYAYGDCVYQGSYSFQSDAQLDNGNGDEYGFVPVVRLYFSTEDYGGSDLGGANIGDCDVNDDQEYYYHEQDSTQDRFGDWVAANEKMVKVLGIVLGVALASCLGSCLLFQCVAHAQCWNPVVSSDDKHSSVYNLMQTFSSFQSTDAPGRTFSGTFSATDSEIV